MIRDIEGYIAGGASRSLFQFAGGVFSLYGQSPVVNEGTNPINLFGGVNFAARNVVPTGPENSVSTFSKNVWRLVAKA